MKFSFVIFSMLSLSASAFAKTYHCDTLADTHGHRTLGGPAYAVEITGEDVVLQVTTGADEGRPLQTTPFTMEKTAQEPDGATYEAEGVTATIITSGFGGHLHTFVTISRGVGAQFVSASCR